MFTGKIKQVNSCPFCKQETLELENKEYGGNMELLKPDYYDEFTCIADKCTISCCREWKINIDDETYRNWKTIQPPSEVPGHRSCLQAYTMKKDGSRIMKMTEEHDCPFLAKNRLCYLVSAYGDSMLSETCQIFPREIHEFQDHKEATMMPCCRLSWTSGRGRKESLFRKLQKKRNSRFFLCAGRLWIL